MWWFLKASQQTQVRMCLKLGKKVSTPWSSQGLEHHVHLYQPKSLLSLSDERFSKYKPQYLYLVVSQSILPSSKSVDWTASIQEQNSVGSRNPSHWSLNLHVTKEDPQPEEELDLIKNYICLLIVNPKKLTSCWEITKTLKLGESLRNWARTFDESSLQIHSFRCSSWLKTIPSPYTSCPHPQYYKLH